MFSKRRISVTGDSIRVSQKNSATQAHGISQGKTEKGSVLSGLTNQVPMSIANFGPAPYTRLLSGIVPDQTEDGLIEYYRDCYYYDSVAGATVDLTSTFPFSDWTLIGVSNPVAAIYSDALSRLNFRSLFSEISSTYLVDGDFISTLIYSKEDRVFQDLMIHDRLNCTITQSPFYSLDPVITVTSNDKLRQFMSADSKFSKEFLRKYPTGLINQFLTGGVDLDPITTLHLPRRSLQDRQSASYLKRVLPIYLLERLLYRGTLVEVNKRQRASTHIQVGTDTWQPTPAEMQTLLSMFQSTEADPLGAWIVTRNGVQVQDVRLGGDFMKWMDVTEQLVPLKLRALGISEAFLSSEANFSCLTGDTLIPTTEGLRRIDSFGSGKEFGKALDINVTMDSRYGKEKAVKWIYNGFQKTIKVTTDTGNSLKATGNHPVLVLNEDGNIDWKRVDKLKVGDVLCVSKNKVVRTKKLKLNVGLPPERERKGEDPGVNYMGDMRGKNPNSHNNYSVGSMTVPKYMTPKLAYWLALFVSEGNTRGIDTHSKDGDELAVGIGFGNSSKRLCKRFVSLAMDLFGVPMVMGEEYTAEQCNADRGPDHPFKATKGFYTVRTQGVQRRLVDWLDAIGVYVKPGRVDGKTPSYFKQVPWSVLQADEECQRAFLAGYAECDGSLYKRTYWFSQSEDLIQQLQAMLNSHGYQPIRTQRKSGTHELSLQRIDSADFWAKAEKYLADKKTNPKMRAGKVAKLDGIPTDYWVRLLRERMVKFDRHGGYYQCDDGKVICWSNNDPETSIHFGKHIKRFNYADIQAGRFKNLLKFFKVVSPIAYEKLKAAFKTNYRFTRVTSLEDNGKQHVYDISMQKGKEPAFVANGLVVHNTGETALSVFLENISAYRDFMTYKIFTSKLFPVIAVMNDLYKEGQKPQINSIHDLLFDVKNRNALDIPTIQWKKSLEARNEENQFEVLEKLSEKGFPIPMKMWAACAGIDISMLLSELTEDENIRQNIEKVTGVKPNDRPDPNDMGGEYDDGGMYEESGRAIPPIKSFLKDKRRKRPILSRTFENSGVKRVSKSGTKVHAVYNERAVQKKNNEDIIKMFRNLQDPEHRANLRKRVTAKMNGVPNILGIPGFGGTK